MGLSGESRGRLRAAAQAWSRASEAQLAALQRLVEAQGGLVIPTSTPTDERITDLKAAMKTCEHAGLALKVANDKAERAFDEYLALIEEAENPN